MILYNLVMEQIEERKRKREALGEAIGRELERREWVAWYNRLQAAKAAGEDFNEPNPAEKDNAAAQNDE